MSDPLHIPVIRIELERMSKSLCVAIMDEHVAMSEEIERAVKSFCEPNKVQNIVSEQVRRTLTAVIQSEVEQFYRNGDGRKAVKAAVIKRLENDTSFTDLDYA